MDLDDGLWRASENGGVTLGEGADVSRNILVGVEKETGSEKGQLSVEMEIVPDLSLTEKVTRRENTRLGIQWSHDD